MWEAIRDILMSPNITVLMIFVGFVIIVAIILTKTGLLKITTNAVQIGAADRERQIIRQQIEWSRLHLEGMEASMRKEKGYNEWRGRYVAQAVFGEYVNWITFNHLSTSPAYIDIKADRVVNLVRSLTYKPEFHSEEFENWLREDTKQSIEKLIQIRQVFKTV